MHLFTYLIFIAYPTFTLCQSPLPSTHLSPHKPESCKWTTNDCKDLKTDPDFDTNCAEGGDGEVFSCFVECKGRLTGDRCEHYCKKHKDHCNGKPSVTTTPSATTVGYTQAPAYRPQDCKWTSEDCRNTNWKTKSYFDTNCAKDGDGGVFSCFVECKGRLTGDRCEHYCKMFQEDCKDSFYATTEAPKNHEHDCKCPEREDHPCSVWIGLTFLFLGCAIIAICGCAILYRQYKSEQVETDVANSPTVVYSRTASEETST